MNKEEYRKNRSEGKRGQGPGPQTSSYNSEKSKAASRRKLQRKKLPTDPSLTKKHTSRQKKNTKEKVRRIEQIRHLFALARKGLFK